MTGYSGSVILSLHPMAFSELFKEPAGVLCTGRNTSLQRESYKFPIDVLVKVSSTTPKKSASYSCPLTLSRVDNVLTLLTGAFSL